MHGPYPQHGVASVPSRHKFIVSPGSQEAVTELIKASDTMRTNDSILLSGAILNNTKIWTLFRMTKGTAKI